MPKVDAYAAMEAGGELRPYTFELGELEADDIDIQVRHVGLCHSDLSMRNNEWGLTQYPFVPGHEVAGVVEAVGTNVKHVKVGDRVGLGWHSGYCNSCAQCLSGDHNICDAPSMTIAGRHGGFAYHVRAQGLSVIKIPDEIDLADAGPLFCGGITVFHPMVEYSLSPLAKVGVIGIGGLGHLAVQFLRAWGCHVTAFTTNPSKASDVFAHDRVNSKDANAIKELKGQYDMILSTVNVGLDWDAYMTALKPKGRLHFLGVLTVPVGINNVFGMMEKQKQISGSPVGSPANINKMLNFAARHSIKPITEHFPMKKVNEAFKRLESGKAHYRIVLDL
uniref:alcohol dehydrogenase (NADP(+)) n=1 Tax=Aplanochytrium stocchinoi TaxID=215587 RepID=A0A7S3LTJ1_9STRA|mmetsp:Transcript_1471/g.1888  ORF Transcript_1471/g.1888 Transcript_1471/m.1888 type:complete len:334 (-) Transcript_1471:1045-2046(-)